ncbi:MAG: sugar phosphate isomerase/epimerase [Butyrivibrio sp.]|nr:sugar phosphate isomerase/epimerase [Butyrivibrio sp.]
MKLSISNIGWAEENDAAVYSMMKKHGFVGLEIAPTRIFPEQPYNKLDDAREWADKLKAENGFVVPSMQSIWYGRTEKLFGTDEERSVLIDYTKKAIDFAETVGCKNLVFGCPRNRSIPDGADERITIKFFKEIGDYAAEHGTVIGMEANPPIYNTNYINDTVSALELIEKVESEGFKLNLDVGTMVENGEDVNVLKRREKYINHVHISEPGLKPIEERQLHRDLGALLKACNYNGFVSIEVGKQEKVENLENMMRYVEEIFG